MATIAEMKPSDRADVKNLLKRCWSETYTDELGQQIASGLVAQLDLDDFAGLLPGDETVFLARDSKRVRGCAFSAARHGTTYLWGCYVLPAYQRQGIGRKLLISAVNAHSLENRVELIVLKSSMPAVSFYKSMGFQLTSDEWFELLPGVVLAAEKLTTTTAKLNKNQARYRCLNGKKAGWV